MSGPLHGVRIIEIKGIGPGPFAGMLLSDLGADVVRVDRADAVRDSSSTAPRDPLGRGRRSIAVDLKQPAGVELVLRLAEEADALFEPFRPGVAERLGFGPETCLARNQRLVYGRMTGWGQDGPYAQAAGHDINYIALTGALDAVGRRGEKPTPPLNLVGDFGGGALYLALGMVAALFEAQRSGQGQVVDAAMVDGATSLMTFFYELAGQDLWHAERGTNFLDSGAWFYDTYETSDHQFVAVGAIEPEFLKVLVEGLGLDRKDLPRQWDERSWPEMHERVAAIFATKTRDEWCAVFDGTDACFAPVLSLAEAPSHPHNRARGAFVEVAGITEGAPAPRFSRTAGTVQRPPADPGAHTTEVLRDWLGCADEELAVLADAGVVRPAD